MKRLKLTPAMIRALRHALRGDTRLYAFETGHKYRSARGRKVQGNTVRALLRRGWLAPVAKRCKGAPPVVFDVRVTSYGRAALENR